MLDSSGFFPDVHRSAHSVHQTIDVVLTEDGESKEQPITFEFKLVKYAASENIFF